MRSRIAVLFAAALLLFPLGSSPRSQIFDPAVYVAGTPAPPVTIPCDVVTCTGAWGMRLLKTGASLAIRITCADATTHDIGFSGNDINKSAADSACSGSSAPHITTIYDQVGTQNCTHAYLDAFPYDNTTLKNGHPTMDGAATAGTNCSATLASGATALTMVSTFMQTASSGNHPTNWATDSSSYGGLQFNAAGTSESAFEYNFSTFIGATGTATASTWQVALVSISNTTVHGENNGTTLGTDQAGQTLSSATTLGLGNDLQGTLTDSGFNGNMTDWVLIANSNTNGHTVACAEAGYWSITVTGC